MYRCGAHGEEGGLDFARFISSTGYLSVFFIMSSNKLVNVSEYFPKFCELIKPKEEIVGTSDLHRSWTEVERNLKSYYLRLALE